MFMVSMRINNYCMCTTARSQLDRYAGHMALLTEVGERFQAYQSLLQCYRALESPDMLRSQLVFQQFQRKELLELAMQPNEIELLYQEHKKLHHLQAYLFSGTQIEACLSLDDGGICRQLSQVEHELKNLPDEDLVVKRMKTLINEALIQCEEGSYGGKILGRNLGGRSRASRKP